MLGALTGRLAEMIDQDRAAGIAKPGADSEALAASLIWGTERIFHIAMTGHHQTLTDQDTILEPLVQLYVWTIYGRPGESTVVERSVVGRPAASRTSRGR